MDVYDSVLMKFWIIKRSTTISHA